jgi:pseudouridine kinase
VGGVNVDIKAKTSAKHVAATSNPGSVSFTPGGVGRNIAHNLALLGLKVSLVSVVGQDAAGDLALAATAAAGVDISLVKRASVATGAYVATLDEKGDLITAVNDMRIMDELDLAFCQHHAPALSAAKFIVADCNLKPDILHWLALQYSDRLIVEPVSVPKSEKLKTLLEKHEIFLGTPNRDQLAALTGVTDTAEACADLHERGLQNIVVHLGPEGAFVSGEGGRRALPSARSTTVSDVTGAGDAAVAGLVFGLCQGYDLLPAAAFGQAAASLVLASTASTAPGLSAAALHSLVKGLYE